MATLQTRFTPCQNAAALITVSILLSATSSLVLADDHSNGTDFFVQILAALFGLFSGSFFSGILGMLYAAGGKLTSFFATLSAILGGHAVGGIGGTIFWQSLTDSAILIFFAAELVILLPVSGVLSYYSVKKGINFLRRDSQTRDNFRNTIDRRESNLFDSTAEQDDESAGESSEPKEIDSVPVDQDKDAP